MIAPMIVLFYFLILRPQQKHAQEQQKMRDSLKSGDAVITIGGLYGTITEVAGDTVTLDAGGRTQLRFDRAAIARRQPAADAAAK
jgi:preprotein translocase subunit YajC